MFENKSILITGGTGTFGQNFTREILQSYNFKKIVIFSRDEMKQWHMAKHFSKYPQIRFFIGDVRDKDRLYRAFKGIDYVVHAAATKIVPIAEYNPFECVKTNVIGSMNVIDAAIDCDVEKVIALSTDKASSPINLYGATKLAADKLFVAGNAYSDEQKTKFAIARYGNVMGSRGSVIPFFISQKNDNVFTITDPEMTRFMITTKQAVKLVIDAFQDMCGGEIYVKKIPSMKVVDIAKAINPTAKLKYIGMRPGEKIHEQMIGLEDAPYTYEFDDYFVIFSQINHFNVSKKMSNGKLVSDDFYYTSSNNKDWMSEKTFLEWLKNNHDKLSVN
ncbi:UDP-N-acetylglucosamine 4,6-dehydratase (inverting) [Alphaproteobacteria bacterium]|nr:UDP-N-acetylglucosamine 4,6-dehydratase (inverting) [Alphaproteobacteria bacterium]